MFDQTFVDTNKKAPPYALALSLFVQVLVLGVSLLIPLLYTQVLPGVSLRSVLAAPAPPTPPPPRILIKAPASSQPTRVFSLPSFAARQPLATHIEPMVV